MSTTLAASCVQSSTLLGITVFADQTDPCKNCKKFKQGSPQSRDTTDSAPKQRPFRKEQLTPWYEPRMLLTLRTQQLTAREGAK